VRTDRSVAGVDEDERAGAVGALAGALVEARLTEQRGLLITGNAGDRKVQGEERIGVGASEFTGRRTDLGQRGRRHLQQVAELVAPRAFVDVVQQSAARV